MCIRDRNIAIIAHVDQGKTTLIDNIMKQSGSFRKNQEFNERLMDSGDLERERGITILAKPTSVTWNDIRINIIDTPGHADFGGEVERVLGMADGVILLIDAAEGPMPQTKFVLGKALKQGLKPIVIINKVDRSDARPEEVLDEVFDLFVALDANDEQLDFPILYASGRDGWCVTDLKQERKNLIPMLDLVLSYVNPPNVEDDKPFAMLATLLDYDPFLGRCLVGKVQQGSAQVNTNVNSINLDGKIIEKGRLTKLFRFERTEKIPVEKVNAGDIICIAGLKLTSVSDTITDPSNNIPLKSTPIDPPTMSVNISVNSSPFAGLEGDKVTSTLIRQRLLNEAETNVAITFQENSNKDLFEIGGRGELQLGVLIETMRREGFEFQISQPQVIFREIDDVQCEPIETLVLDVPEVAVGSCIEKLGSRKAEMKNMQTSSDGRTQLEFLVPSRGLIGFRGEFVRITRGEGIMSHSFYEYKPKAGDFETRRNGVLISFEEGVATFYALKNAEDRGVYFIKPGVKVYKGMIIGENNRSQDLELNICKTKQLTNMRSAGAEELDTLQSPVDITLERALEYIGPDEMLEVTPDSIRMRKLNKKKAMKK